MYNALCPVYSIFHPITQIYSMPQITMSFNQDSASRVPPPPHNVLCVTIALSLLFFVVGHSRLHISVSPRAGGLGGELQALRNSEVFAMSPPCFASCRVFLVCLVFLVVSFPPSFSCLSCTGCVACGFRDEAALRPLWVCGVSRLRFSFHFSG
jgi:hypothetical protein